jgi:ATP-dependent exoDNAse (exonuclease V) beta subunit
VFFESGLPDEFTKEKSSLKKLPLFELTETLISIFKLGSFNGELSYIQAFQDLVMDFYSRERNDLGLFLEWWEENKAKKSITVSGEVDAAQIITIHKAKGLQFKYVIIPFCSWGLDHDSIRSPNLWVKNINPPFNNAGYIPIKYSGGLDKTYFKEYYEEEKTRCYLDNLNLLYVAFTRAENGLIVFAPGPEERNVKKTVAFLLYECVQSDITLQNNWKLADRILEIGEIAPVQSAIKESSSAIALHEYTSTTWRDKLVIRQAASTFFEGTDHEGLVRARYGVFIHNILSEIKYIDNLDEELGAMLNSGFITSLEMESLKGQLRQLFSDPQIASWFSSEWQVRNEVPILLPGGKESRIDRLIHKNQRAIVIDFKTGKPSNHDQRQVMEYIQTLRLMNFIEVEGYLLYIQTGDVVSVKAGKAKAVKKKDSQQLDLGIN